MSRSLLAALQTSFHFLHFRNGDTEDRRPSPGFRTTVRIPLCPALSLQDRFPHFITFPFQSWGPVTLCKSSWVSAPKLSSGDMPWGPR